jgi:bacterioferritin-associated ferredoxin
MFVCVCHALTDADVKAAARKGATGEAEVFCSFGVRPQCGRCIPTMRCLLGAPACANAAAAVPAAGPENSPPSPTEGPSN